MSRRGNGLISAWAEAQRQEQRRQDAQRRAAEQRRREEERQQRAAEQAMARMHREQRAEYRRHREADALRRTEEIERQADALAGLLAAGCRGAAFRSASMLRPERVEPFQPGHLGVPVPMPVEANYQPAQGSWGFGPNAQAQQQARAQFERDWYAAQNAEAQRLRQLEAYRQQYDQWAETTLAQLRQHNGQVRALGDSLRRGDADAAVQFFSAALYASTAWPDDFPRQVDVAYERSTRELVLDWQLPSVDVVPEVRSVRYMPSTDQDKEVTRTASQRRTLYRDVLAQCVLLVLRELFVADEFGALASIAVNGFVDDLDPATGLRARIFLSSVRAPRTEFERLNLARVSAVDCLVDALGGVVSMKPDLRTAVQPARRPDAVSGSGGSAVVSHADNDDVPDLLEMDPIAFEGLVAELFRARGLQAVTTQRSGDGGVDVEAIDPDPLSGGKIIVQVKRYRHTVPPTAVRDLYGTVHDVGANKGVLVTTSRFGPSSYTFARGKPLTLITGDELVDLMTQVGLNGRLGPGATQVPGPRGSSDAAEPVGAASGQARAGATAVPPGTLPASGTRGQAGAPASAPATAPSSASESASDDANVLGMTWSGGVALDVCALVCTGQRVLSDDHFVFYNNTSTPDGAVRSVPVTGGDKAAVRVAFDALPGSADRVVLVAAIDPSVNPTADLSGFTDAAIVLRDAAGGELDRLTVSDGRADETALVLGSFRRRSNGDWAFVIGGRGYRDGLEALLGDFGIDVA
ncbi:restriction endonuclease [Yinghuangia sp. ASG 101]|uniref:restriction endonuclease n=1 Tax=Yinghuangia sp. ASG 101 TaxID=2896848 RepID=UPI001E4E4880|nr:restriction endonuclease [Yinghuangia sp. ASG 101]UGQ10424.1 restriction endonuclease [Yinghuangia sp. ASG 101]